MEIGKWRKGAEARAQIRDSGDESIPSTAKGKEALEKLIFRERRE